jgi:hypothetical protein
MRKWIFAVALVVASSGAPAMCLYSDDVSLILDAHARGESLVSIQRGFFPGADAEKLATVEQIYKSGVKPWDADELSMKLCRPEISASNANNEAPIVQNSKCPYGAHVFGGGAYECVKSPDQVAADRSALEKRKEADYKDSFNRVQNIPGICVGSDCKNIRKIQHWDANGNMLN